MDLLRGTGKRRLEEASKTDAYWGAGGNGKGQNRLGEMLMTLRDQRRVPAGWQR